MRAERRLNSQQRTVLRRIDQARARFPDADAVLVNATANENANRQVIEDLLLPPSAKVLWLVLAGQSESACRFPAMSQLQRLVNTRSASTCPILLEVLRIRRWLAVNEPQAGSGPQVSLLHAPPLSPEDVLVIDGGYEGYLEGLQDRSHARLRGLATDALNKLQKVQTRQDDPAPDRWAFARSRGGRLRPTSEQLELPQRGVEVDRQQRDDRPRASTRECLVFPGRWAPEQVQLAQRYLNSVESSLRQVILDELEGRVAAVARGAAPVYDEVRFLGRLCKAAKAGTFEPNLGGSVRRQREQERQRRTAHRPRAAGPKGDAGNAAAATRAFDQIWATLSSGSESTP